mgnify:CR=1 FL=1
MHLPRKEAAIRAIERYLGEEGPDGKKERSRLVPVPVVLKMIDNEKNFDTLKEHFDVWSAYDNQGDGPVLLSRSK